MIMALKLPPSIQRPPVPPRRRLSDKIRAAIHAACDENAVGIAACLLVQLESLLTYPPVLSRPDRRTRESLADVRKRLWI
jgi:hypothetical protein